MMNSVDYWSTLSWKFFTKVILGGTEHLEPAMAGQLYLQPVCVCVYMPVCTCAYTRNKCLHETRWCEAAITHLDFSVI